MANHADLMQLDSLTRLAASQHGVVATRQLKALDVSDSALVHLVRSGEWQRRSSKVLVRTGSPPSRDQDLMVAALHHGPEAYLTRGAALRLWGVPGFESVPLDLVVRRPNRGQRSRTAHVHTSTDLRDTQIAEVRGLPVTTPARALFDLAATGHARKVERALDNAWARGLVNHQIMMRTIDELAKKGRTGITLLRELMAERPAEHRPPESNTEARLNQLLVEDCQRPLERQVDVGDDHHWVGRVDLRDAVLPRLLVEVQSELFHGSKLDQDNDRLRLAALRAAGFTVLEIWDTEIWHRPQAAVDRIRAARSALEQRPGLEQPRAA